MSTGLTTECPHCGKVLRVSAEMAGKRARCPGCHQAFSVSEIGVSGGTSIAPSQMAAATQGTDSTTIPLPPLPAGKQIGRFELKAELGRGGFGQVFRAYDPVLERDVALKLPRFSGGDEAQQRRFVVEAKSAARLKHPHIVGVYECGDADGQPYIVSEFVPGETLAHRLKRERPSLSQAVIWVRELADALAYAHREGVVHRDIKPGNIMIDGDNRPLILDFGLAKRLGDDVSYSAATVEGNVLGTPAYMSPEQARGELDQVGPASDQYSLGVVLYELLSGRTPFEGHPYQVVAQVASLPVPPLRENLNLVPPDLEAICLKALQQDPSRRYPEITLLASDLDRWLEGGKISAPLSSRWQRVLKKRPRISRTASLITLISVLLAMVGIAAVGLVQEYLSHRAIVQPAAANSSLSDNLFAYLDRPAHQIQTAVAFLLAAVAMLLSMVYARQKFSGWFEFSRPGRAAAAWMALSAVFSPIFSVIFERGALLIFGMLLLVGLAAIPLRPGRIVDRWHLQRWAFWNILVILGAASMPILLGLTGLVCILCLLATAVLFIYFRRSNGVTWWFIVSSGAGGAYGGLLGCLYWQGLILMTAQPNQGLVKFAAMFSGFGILAGAMLASLGITAIKLLRQPR